LASEAPQLRPSLLHGQFWWTWLLLLVLFATWIPVLTHLRPHDALQSIGVLVTVACLGIWLCNRTTRSLGDPKLAWLPCVWLAKLYLTLVLLQWGWIPQLDPYTSTSWGYDPQRYYADSVELASSGFTAVLPALNYQGIIYFFAGAMWVFGQDPAVPAMINSIITLVGALFLVRGVYDFTAFRLASDWTICLVLLIPEVIWFDCMTSRETVMATLLIVATLSIGRAMTSNMFGPQCLHLSLFAAAVAGILLIRTSMLLPVLLTAGALAVATPASRLTAYSLKAVVIALALAAVIFGPQIQSDIGGSGRDYSDILSTTIDRDSNAINTDWNDRSIGRALLPTSPLEAVAFTPPRLILYLVAPLPSVAVPLENLLAGSWQDWQRLALIPGSLLMLTLTPLVLAAGYEAWRTRKTRPQLLIIPISLLACVIAVSGGNTIIHERYRIMFVALFVACAWLAIGRASMNTLRVTRGVWISLLFTGGLTAVALKLY
jgi:hypothetical protein